MKSKGDKILIKNTATRNDVGLWYTKRLLAEFPNKHWPLTGVKHLQRKTDDNLPVEENEKLLLNKILYNFSKVLLILYIKFTFIGISVADSGPLS